jgi:hypothetical protein
MGRWSDCGALPGDNQCCGLGAGEHHEREQLLRAKSKAQSMRYLPAIMALVACSSAIADAPEELRQRDGEWLQNGIRQYERINAHENLSERETNDARVVTSYVCAVADLEKYLVQRAELLAEALDAVRKKHHINPQVLDGMAEALPMLVPLVKTKFFRDSPSCDAALVIVRDYLEKYPEVLTKDADAVVEKALFDAYANSNEP